MSPLPMSQTGPPALMQFFAAACVTIAAALPIGPVSILTVQRGVTHGFLRAFWPTLGAVLADAVFGAIAALGTGFLSSAIMGGKPWLRLAGGVILAAIGLRLFTHHAEDRAAPRESFGILHMALLNFALVLSNPMTLAWYLAAFALLGLKSPRLFSTDAVVLTAGIVFGSLLWFAFLCVLAGRFHMKIGDRMLHRVRAGVGILVGLLGLASAASALLG